MKKRTIVISVIIIAILSVGVYYFYNTRSKPSDEVEKYTVTTGDAVLHVKVSGTAKLLNEQKLSFAQEGKITNVSVRAGDEVVAGQILAEISLDNYEKDVEAAKLAVQNAELGLTRLLNPNTTVAEQQLRTQISNLQNNLTVEVEKLGISRSRLTNTLQQLTQELANKKTELSIAQKSLNVAKSSLDTQIKTETEQTLNSLETTEQAVQNSIRDLYSFLDDLYLGIEEIDKIFGVTSLHEQLNDSYENLLSAKNSKLKTSVNSLVNQSYSIVSQQREKLNTLALNPNSRDLINYIDSIASELDVFLSLTDTSNQALQASIQSSALTAIDISGFENTITSQRSMILTIQASLNTKRNGLEDLISGQLQAESLYGSIQKQEVEIEQQEATVDNLEKQISLLEKELQTTQKDNNNQIASLQTQIDSLRKNISLSIQELNDILDGADQVDIDTQKNVIQQNKIQLEKVIDRKDEYQIIAEFDGRVRSVEITKGEEYELDQREFIIIENPDLIELELQISQIDIVEVREGNPVTITFDAYTDHVIDGKIDSIDFNPLQNQRGGTSYKATVLLEKQEMEIFAGMTAIVDIEAAKAESVIIVPNLAIKTINGKQYVEVINEDNSTYLQEIEIGLDDNFQSEIVSGLDLGQTINAQFINEEDFEAMGITTEGDIIF